MTPEAERLLEAAYTRTLASFEEEVRRGERDAAKEIGDYRRRRRDYATALRMDIVPGEAQQLAEKLRNTHGLELANAAQHEFEREVARMLVRLYDAFIDAARNQGSR